jgi:hypothetical protein
LLGGSTHHPDLQGDAVFAFWYYSASWLTLGALTLYSLATTRPTGTADVAKGRVT